MPKKKGGAEAPPSKYHCASTPELRDLGVAILLTTNVSRDVVFVIREVGDS